MRSTAERDATIRARVLAGESAAVVARDLGLSRQRVHQLTRYVCLDHPRTPLSNVLAIRVDIYRPDGAVVVGECAECHAKRKHYGLSYGRVTP